ncbi:uncharacterized protein LOC122825527 isoform X1 [Gambusia affinis]|uniref:uncharacterized protein LOC122825527 isoform X1 n=1 Tax=Gambusia affinis TaxID=33528 RepID=UPI001CDB682F|nr:uncharacterized protein LOC122825527 isoform X1 [Gambusia affinis]
MLSFKWISKTLFTILMLQLTATAGQQRALFTVIAGDGVTLPCGNVGQTKHNCDRITWMSRQPGNRELLLFEGGDFTEEANTKSGRLSVTADCSLVIENVTVEDFGRYNCRQNHFKKVDLSVVTMTEQRNNGNVTFTCSVSQYTYCRHPVLWLYEGKEKISPDMNVSSSCSATVTIPAFHLDQNSKFYELLKCRVQDGYVAKQYLLFTFSHQSSGQERGKTPKSSETTTQPISTTRNRETIQGDKATTKATTMHNPAEQQGDLSFLRYIIVSVGVIVLLMCVAIVTIWEKIQYNKTAMKTNTVNRDQHGETSV